MRDLRKLFSQQTSQYFHVNEQGQKVTSICGEHPEISGALSPYQVLRILNGGKDEMESIAREYGYTNTDVAEFYVEFIREWDERGDDYDPYNVSHEVFYLKATERL